VSGAKLDAVLDAYTAELECTSHPAGVAEAALTEALVHEVEMRIKVHDGQ
jgi:hypothetical protein